MKKIDMLNEMFSGTMWEKYTKIMMKKPKEYIEKVFNFWKVEGRNLTFCATLLTAK